MVLSHTTTGALPHDQWGSTARSGGAHRSEYSALPRWILIVIGGVVIAAIGSAVTLLFVANISDQTAKDMDASIALQAAEQKQAEQKQAESEIAKLQKIRSICDAAFEYPDVFFAVSADGKSATLNSPDGWQVKCITYTLKAPSSIYDQVLATRAIDGTRSASWGNWTANWTYHPDAGVTFIIQHN